MRSFDRDGGLAVVPADARIRARTPRYGSEFEKDIRQLYLRAIDEPIPPRLMDVLRAGLSNQRS